MVVVNGYSGFRRERIADSVPKFIESFAIPHPQHHSHLNSEWTNQDWSADCADCAEKSQSPLPR